MRNARALAATRAASEHDALDEMVGVLEQRILHQMRRRRFRDRFDRLLERIAKTRHFRATAVQTQHKKEKTKEVDEEENSEINAKSKFFCCTLPNRL